MAWGCKIVRSLSLVPYLLIHGIFYKDSHNYLMPSVFMNRKAIIVPAVNLILFSKVAENKITHNKRTNKPPKVLESRKYVHIFITFKKSLIFKLM